MQYVKASHILFLLFMSIVGGATLCSLSVQAEPIATQEEWQAEYDRWDGERKNWHQPPTAANGIPFPTNYRDWKVIAVSHRLDRNSVRVIIGNDIAVKAARSKNINPWPDGSLLVKVPWRQRKLPAWQDSWVTGDLLSVSVMLKDSKQFKDTLGWGFATWQGLDLKLPKDHDATVQKCVDCHAPEADHDYVFTVPSILP